ncbi:chemotaxis protein CheW [Pelosinus sp. sgz500959]|uniref:chemotaxis protein CheW n=1 Tax=Pelosinus sp. sgz500959 TaxID=3242472 RepID=UPI00366C5C3F
MTGRVLTFYLCGTLCGIDIKAAKEINRNISYTAIPGAAAHIIGLLNLRGQVVTLLDLAQILHFKQIGERMNSHCIILKSRSDDPDQVGFFIDKRGDVIDVTPDMCEVVPANIADFEKKFIHEVVKLEDEILLILDLSAIIQTEASYPIERGV